MVSVNAPTEFGMTSSPATIGEAGTEVKLKANNPPNTSLINVCLIISPSPGSQPVNTFLRSISRGYLGIKRPEK